MPNETQKTIALTINYGVDYKLDVAIAGEVREILGEIGVNVFAVSRTGYADGVVTVNAVVYIPVDPEIAANLEVIAQAVINKRYPGSIPETPAEHIAEEDVQEIIDETNPGIGS